MKKGGRMKRWGSIALVIGACLVAASGIVHAGDKGQTARLAKAEATFAERCKKAGEFIHRTVDDVEGVFLMKIRPDGINYGDQLRMAVANYFEWRAA